MKVSVVIPAYNEIETIDACLSALMSQTVQADEILVVDNNSSDGTPDFVKKQYPSVRVLHEETQGLIPARNLGFSKAKHYVLGRIDADTIVDPNWVEKLHEIFVDPDISAATGPSYTYDTPFQNTALKGQKLFHHTGNEIISGHKTLWGSNMAITKHAWDIIKDTACNEKDILEDLDLAIHISEAGLKIHFDPELITGISGRRFRSSPKELAKYMQMWPDTYTLHGDHKRARAAKACASAALLLHAPLYVVLKGYDPKTKTFSLKNFKIAQDYDKGNP